MQIMKAGTLRAKMYLGVLALGLFSLFFKWWFAVLAAALAIIVAGTLPAQASLVCVTSGAVTLCDVDACTRARIDEADWESRWTRAANTGDHDHAAWTAQHWRRAYDRRHKECGS